jgi:hypothetical protein
MGKKVCFWNVYETAENVLRSRVYADFCEDYRSEREKFEKNVDGRLNDLQRLVDLKAVKMDVDGIIESLKTTVNTKADRTDLETRIKELKDVVDLAAVKTDVEQDIRRLEGLVDKAAKKIDVDNSFESVQTDVDTRATQADFNDLETRVAALEAKMMGPPKRPDPLPTGGGTGDTPVTNNDDAKNSSTPPRNPPEYITYSRREDLKSVAKDLSLSEEYLQQYNKEYNKNMNLDTKKFWSGEVGEKAVVLLPKTDDGKPPQRVFQTDAHPFDPHSSGRVIANYFGYTVIPKEMEVTRTRSNNWVRVDPDLIYNDHTMRIPAASYRAPAS